MIADVLELDGALHRAGCTIRYADSRTPGPAVVFLHGAGADHAMFRAQRDALVQAGSRVVLLDLRGHGTSRPNTGAISAPALVADVEALVAGLGLSRPALVGHSLGGNVGQRLVRRRPDGYAALAVLGAAWNSGPLTAVERVALVAAAPLLRLVPARALPRLLARASAVTAPARADLARAFSIMSKAEFLAVWRATARFVDPDPAHRTPVPLLLVRGDRDRTGNIAAAMPRWAQAEGAREVVVPAAGHVVTQDAPERVSEVLRTFLDGVRDRAR